MIAHLKLAAYRVGYLQISLVSEFPNMRFDRNRDNEAHPFDYRSFAYGYLLFMQSKGFFNIFPHPGLGER